MNVVEGLQAIRGRLEANEAEPETLALVEQIRKRAALPSAGQASAQSLLQLTRMLLRHPTTSSNVRIYNDLARLEEELESGATAYRERALAEDAKPVPKTKKFYKEQKDREKKAAG